ncbi:hypothetical protein [Halovulum sp. GXIMD14793]
MQIKVAFAGAGGNQTVFQITDLASPGSWVDSAIDFETIRLTNFNDTIQISREVFDGLLETTIIIDGLGGTDVIDASLLDQTIEVDFAQGSTKPVVKLTSGAAAASTGSSENPDGLEFEGFEGVVGTAHADTNQSRYWRGI